MVKRDSRLIALIVVRSLCLLAIAMWLGGLGFFGAFAAPAMFRITREHNQPEIGPILVGIMLGRFNVVTYLLSVILLLGWLVDGFLEKAVAAARNWWFLQGLATVVSLGLALYLGLALLPYTVQQQGVILPIYRKRALEDEISMGEKLQLAQFDVTHKMYNMLASINLWALVVILVALCARLSLGRRESTSASS